MWSQGLVRVVIQCEVAAASDLFIKTISFMQIAVGDSDEEMKKRLRGRKFIGMWMASWDMTDRENDVEVKTGVEVFMKGNVFSVQNPNTFRTFCLNEIDFRQRMCFISSESIHRQLSRNFLICQMI